jgi:hypothetical protein
LLTKFLQLLLSNKRLRTYHKSKLNTFPILPNPWVAICFLSYARGDGWFPVWCGVGSVAVLFRSVASEASAGLSGLCIVSIWRVFLEMINPQQIFGFHGWSIASLSRQLRKVCVDARFRAAIAMQQVAGRPLSVRLGYPLYCGCLFACGGLWHSAPTVAPFRNFTGSGS